MEPISPSHSDWPDDPEEIPTTPTSDPPSPPAEDSDSPPASQSTTISTPPASPSTTISSSPALPLSPLTSRENTPVSDSEEESPVPEPPRDRQGGPRYIRLGFCDICGKAGIVEQMFCCPGCKKMYHRLCLQLM